MKNGQMSCEVCGQSATCVCLVSPALSAGAIDDSMLLMLFWILTGLSVLGLFSQRYGLQPLTFALIIRSIYHFGIGNTLILLGTLNVSGSKTGTFTGRFLAADVAVFYSTMLFVQSGPFALCRYYLKYCQFLPSLYDQFT